MNRLSFIDLQTLYCLTDQIDHIDQSDTLMNGLRSYLDCLSCYSIALCCSSQNQQSDLIAVGNLITDQMKSMINQFINNTEEPISTKILNKSKYEAYQLIVMRVTESCHLIFVADIQLFSDAFLQELQKINRKFIAKIDQHSKSEFPENNQTCTFKDILLDNLPYQIWLKDKNGKYLDCNKKYCETLGYDKKSIIGHTDYELFDENQARFYHSRDEEVIKNKKSISYKESLFSKQGIVRVFEINKIPIIMPNGEANGVIGFSLEITHDKQIKTALQKTNQRFEDLSNLLPIPVWEADASGKLIYLNAAGLKLFGKKTDEIPGLNLFSLIPAKFHSNIFNMMNSENGINKALEIECYIENKSNIPIVFYGNSIQADNKITGYRGSITDISDQKLVENELLTLSRLQNLLIRISTEYINVSIDRVEEATYLALKEIGEFVDADRAYIFTYDHTEKTTSNTFEWCQDGIDPQIDTLQNIPYNELPRWIESHFNGETIYIDDVKELIDPELKSILEPQGILNLITVPMMNKNVCTGFVGFDSVRKIHRYSQYEKSTLEVFAQVLVNIQLRSKQETELKEAKTKAEQAEKAQFNFLSTMSHEIRTPLNAVIGLTNILLMEKPKKSQLNNLTTLKQSSNNLLNIINNILDYNKLISGNVILEHKNFNFKELISNIYQSLESVAANKGVELKLDFSKKIPNILIGDSTRITQIINNLLTNAIKFTKKGRVIIEVKLLERFQSDVLLHVSVQDNGIGIPKDKFDEIFEEFRQSNESITREFGGTGLGLPIVKKLLKNMGSDIYLESELGKGSIFSFNLKLPIGDQSYKSDLEEDINFDSSLKDMRILVVEDNKVNQLVVNKFLLDWKCKIDIADNGQIALEKISNNQYDAVLMDLHMPVLDGYEATKKIRELDSEEKRNIPIIALSASALGEIEVRARKFGMDAFVTKPFVPGILFKTLFNFKKISSKTLTIT